MGIDIQDSEYTEIIRERLREIQDDLDVLVRGDRWLVWSCIVSDSPGYGKEFYWHFRPDFTCEPPIWFDIDREPGKSLIETLCMSRLPEDNVLCNMRSDEALRTGAPGYTQTFRVRLRSGRVSWVEENVTIQPMSDGRKLVMGVVTDATQRKEDQERMQNLQEELIANQEELMAQNAELAALRDKLEQEKVALAAANSRLESLATTDGLIGIKNHRAFQEQLEHDWSAAVRYQTPLSLVMLDIDHFKLFNDTFGHPAGDGVLQQVGRILFETVRASDCLARYGGEEFVVILPHTDRGGALALSDRFRANIEAHEWTLRGITASIGISSMSVSHSDAQALIVDADRALYRAKTAGRNCVVHAADISSVAGS